MKSKSTAGIMAVAIILCLLGPIDANTAVTDAEDFDYQILMQIFEEDLFCEKIKISPEPSDPSIVHIWAPNELITPVKIEAAVGIYNSTSFHVLIGPFDWHPAIEGWGTSLKFLQPVEGSVVGIAAFQGGEERDLRNWEFGCGVWGKTPLEFNEIFLPVLLDN